jgi:hypothetical protein
MFANYLNEISHPILMFGGSNSGKTMVAYVILNNLASMKDYQVVGIMFHCNSTRGSLHDVLKPRLIIEKRRILTLISHKKLAIFVDDMNMSSQTTIQFLRCLIELKGWYKLPFEVSFMIVHGLMHLAIMNFHGFTTCSPLVRLLRHYFVVQCFEYSYTSLVSIFNTILERYYNHDKLDLNYCYQKNLIQSINTTFVQVYLKLKAPIILPNNNECQQYVIQLHDLFMSSKGY